MISNLYYYALLIYIKCYKEIMYAIMVNTVIVLRYERLL